MEFPVLARLVAGLVLALLAVSPAVAQSCMPERCTRHSCWYQQGQQWCSDRCTATCRGKVVTRTGKPYPVADTVDLLFFFGLLLGAGYGIFRLFQWSADVRSDRRAQHDAMLSSGAAPDDLASLMARANQLTDEIDRSIAQSIAAAQRSRE